MKRLPYPLGISSFKEIRSNGYYYIDKTGLVQDILRDPTVKVTLITRPRRFGKTLAMQMLDAFFDLRQDSSAIFEGLEIMNHPELCAAWMNQYPTLYLTLKDISGLNFEGAFAQLCYQIADLYQEHAYLLDSDVLSPRDRALFEQLRMAKGGPDQIGRSLTALLRMMNQYYKKPVIFLLDEYDVPIAKASANGYYREMLEVIKVMLSTALKDNPNLQLAVLTGCLKIAKESIFTGAGYEVASNKDIGEGRSDVVVYDLPNGRVTVFEAKYAKSLAGLSPACDAALKQIDTRLYAKALEDDYDDILCYGIAFFKKRCQVAKK